MAFTYHDVIERLGLLSENEPCKEIFSYKTNIEIFTPEKAIELFPELADVSNQNVIYAPVRMCHSLPTVNKRGRCFTKKTLENSSSLVTDNLVNFDHEISDNGFTKAERICGHLRGSRLMTPSDEGQPSSLIALSVLYSRHPEIKKMAKEHVGNTPWYVSMECGHSLLESHLYYDGEFIPFKDAPSGMLQCIGSEEIANFRGKQLALAVGGYDGIANFWGMALTRTPADENSNILSMFTASGKKPDKIIKEAASISFPIKFEISNGKGNNPETINDKVVHEMGAIKVIGRTSENDGHSHEILSDGTVFPENGHSHYVDHFLLETGSKPKFSAKLNEYSENVRIVTDYPETYERRIHSHTLEIDLKQKVNSVNNTGEIGNKGEGEMGKNYEEAIEKLSKIGDLFKELASKNNLGDDNLKLDSLKFLAGVDFEKVIASAVEEAVEEKIASGEVVKKEDAEAQVNEKVSEAIEAKEKEIELEKKVAEMKQSRVDSVKEAGIDIEFAINETTKISDVIESIPYTDEGHKLFETNLAIWKALAANKSSAPVKEAANAPAATPKKPQSPLLAVGGGPSGTKQPSNAPSIGKNRITVV